MLMIGFVVSICALRHIAADGGAEVGGQPFNAPGYTYVGPPVTANIKDQPGYMDAMRIAPGTVRQRPMQALEDYGGVAAPQMPAFMQRPLAYVPQVPPNEFVADAPQYLRGQSQMLRALQQQTDTLRQELARLTQSNAVAAAQLQSLHQLGNPEASGAFAPEGLPPMIAAAPSWMAPMQIPSSGSAQQPLQMLQTPTGMTWLSPAQFTASAGTLGRVSHYLAFLAGAVGITTVIFICAGGAARLRAMVEKGREAIDDDAVRDTASRMPSGGIRAYGSFADSAASTAAARQGPANVGLKNVAPPSGGWIEEQDDR